MKIIKHRFDETLIETKGDHFVIRHSDPRNSLLRIHSIKRATHHDHGCYSHTDVNPFCCRKSLPASLVKAMRELVLESCVKSAA